MLNKIIAIAVKISGGGWVWEKVNGYKTKLAGIGLMLSGAGMMLGGAASIVSAAAECEAMSCMIGIARGISENPHALLIGKGFLIFQGGLATLGVGHKIEKGQVPAPKQDPPS